jgi:hypothetical protein
VVTGETAPVRSAQRIEVDVLGNDTDPDGDLDATTLTIVSGPASGVASVHGGAIRYDAPEVASAVQVKVGYRVCDRGGRCASGVLKIVVTP